MTSACISYPSYSCQRPAPCCRHRQQKWLHAPTRISHGYSCADSGVHKNRRAVRWRSCPGASPQRPVILPHWSYPDTLPALTLCARWRYRFAHYQDQRHYRLVPRCSTPLGTLDAHATVADGVLVGLSQWRTSIIDLAIQCADGRYFGSLRKRRARYMTMSLSF